MSHDLIRRLGGDLAEDIIEILKKEGVIAVNDLAGIDNEDIHDTFDNAEHREVVKKARDEAKKGHEGWAKLVAWQWKIDAASTPAPTEPAPCPKTALSSSSSSARPSALVALTKSHLRGHKAVIKKKFAFKNLKDRENELMNVAKELIHTVFVENASDTPRFLSLRTASALEWEMQKDTYRLGSRSHRVVRRRANMISGFFADMTSYGWDFKSLTPFRVAAWARGRVQGGGKSAASNVTQILRLVASALMSSAISPIQC